MGLTWAGNFEVIKTTEIVYLPKSFLILCLSGITYLIALSSNYKVKARQYFFCLTKTSKRGKFCFFSYLNIKIRNIQHLTDIMSLVTGQSSALSELNIIRIYFPKNIASVGSPWPWPPHWPAGRRTSSPCTGCRNCSPHLDQFGETQPHTYFLGWTGSQSQISLSLRLGFNRNTTTC